MLLLLLAACGSLSTAERTPPGTQNDPPAEVADSDTPEVPPADTPPEAPPEDSAAEPPPEDPPADTPPGPPQVVRFVAIGDAGEGNSEQHAVADGIRAVCDRDGCDFALYLGDNFYEDGVDGVDDDQFRTKFEEPYADLDFPFYVVLGNHDFGEIPVEFWRTDYQVEYTRFSTKWTMPDHFYTEAIEHLQLIGLDTNMIMLGMDWIEPQRPWIRRVLQQSAQQTWRIAYGHHPWRSNGEHGNAGNYEGAWFDPTGLVNGQLIQDFFRDELCREIDFYICGHDHNRQWLEPTCGVNLIVSGAGAKTTDFVHRDRNPTIWGEDSGPGFTWIELVDRTATIRFYDMGGALEYEGVITK